MPRLGILTRCPWQALGPVSVMTCVEMPIEKSQAASTGGSGADQSVTKPARIAGASSLPVKWCRGALGVSAAKRTGAGRWWARERGGGGRGGPGVFDFIPPLRDGGRPRRLLSNYELASAWVG